MKTYEHYPYPTKITDDDKTYKKLIKNIYCENIPLSDILSCNITNDLLANNPILNGINSLRKRLREDSQIHKIVFNYRMYTTSTPNTTLLGLKALLNAMYTNKKWEISLIKFPDDVKQDTSFKHITKSMSLDLYEAISLSVDILSCKDPNFIPYYITPPKSDDEIVCIEKITDAIRIPCDYRGPNFLYIISILGKSKVLAGVLTLKNRDTKSLIKLKWVPINVRNDSSYYIRHDGIEYNISEHINRYNLKRISF